ncbi:MAG: hypothetical protein ACPIA1_02950 [Flavobacteriaceae bacterium]
MTKNLIYSGIAGTVVYFLLGWLVHMILFPDMSSDSENMSMVNIVLGCLFYAFVLAYILTKLTNVMSFKEGFNIGLILGLLYGLSWYFFLLAGTVDFVALLKEVVSGALTTAITAGAIGLVNRKAS